MLRTLLKTLVISLTVTNLYAHDYLQPGTYDLKVEVSWDKTEQPFNLYVPSQATEGESLPLVVALHGKAASYQTWFDVTRILEFAEKKGWAVLAPQGRGDWFYLGPGEQDVVDQVAEVKRLVSIDENRVYIVGHSMGGWGSWHFAASRPDIFAACVTMSGWAPHELLGNFEHTPVLVIHGDADIPVTNEYSREAVSILGKLGVSHRYIEAPGYGHDSTMINDYFENIAGWFEEHQGRPIPTKISHTALTPRRGKAWWLQIDDIDTWMDPATLEATIIDNKVSIQTKNVSAFQILPSEFPSDTEVTSLSIDGSVTFPFAAPYFYQLTEEGWKAPKEIPQLNGPEFETPVPEDLLGSVGKILLEETDATAVLLTADYIGLDPRGDKITIDDLLDMYLRQRDRLYIAEVPRDQFFNLIRDTEWIPAWWGELRTTVSPEANGSETLKVLMPEVMALLFPHETVATEQTLRKAVFEYLKTNGSFPTTQ